MCRKLYIKKSQRGCGNKQNQTKKRSVLAEIYKVYIIYAFKCDAFGNSFFPLLSIMECLVGIELGFLRK